MLVAMPVHGGVSPATLQTILGLLGTGQGGAYADVRDCPWLDMARAELVGLFLESTHQELFFIDADIAFHPGLVATMRAAKADVICASYRKRNPPHDFTARMLPGLGGRGGDVTLRESPMREAAGARIIEIAGDGLGCCLLQRHVLEELTRRHPELRYVSRAGKDRCNLFEYGVREIEGVRRAGEEDHAFFTRVAAAGFKVECVLDAVVAHGPFVGSLGSLWPLDQKGSAAHARGHSPIVLE
jgi:hypothetical protein